MSGDSFLYFGSTESNKQFVDNVYVQKKNENE